MIAFDLVCTNGHKFECWFRDNASFEEQKFAGIMHLAAAGGIEGRAVQHDGMAAFALQGFDNAGVKVEEKRVVIVEAVSHLFSETPSAARGPYLHKFLILKQSHAGRASRS